MVINFTALWCLFIHPEQNFILGIGTIMVRLTHGQDIKSLKAKMFLNLWVMMPLVYPRKIMPSRQAFILTTVQLPTLVKYASSLKEWAVCMIGMLNWWRAIQSITSGINGCSFSFTKREWHTEKMHRWIGVLKIKLFLQTSRFFLMELVKDAELWSFKKILHNGFLR